MNAAPDQSTNDKSIASAGSMRDADSWTSLLTMLAIGMTIAMILVPVDSFAAELARKMQPGGGLALGGDVKRELEFAQQFGAFTSVVLIWVAILRLDPQGKIRLPSFLAATAINTLVCTGMKMFFGRPRPKFLSPHELTFPWETFNMPADTGVRVIHAWESSQLWSFPSSHAAAAAVLAVYLSRMYPKLKQLAIALAIVVATARVVLHAHYPSDVVAGATIGAIIGRISISRILPNGLASRKRAST